MVYLVFDQVNATKATFTKSSFEQIQPVSISGGLFALSADLEADILTFDPTVEYETRELSDSEFGL